MIYDEALVLIEQELDRAEGKFPGFPIDPIHAATIVSEEAGELAQAALQFTYELADPEEMRKEAVQTAAMAVRFLIALDQMESQPSMSINTEDYR